MVVNRKVTGRASSVPAGLAAGAITALGITLVTSLFVAYLVSGEYIGQDKIGYGAIFVLLMASAIGSWFAIRKIKKMPIQMAALSGLLFYVMLLSMTALFFGGQFNGMAVTLVFVLVGSGAGGIMASARSKKQKQKYHKF